MSRNKTQGRYAGKTKGKHVRTHNHIAGHYKLDDIYNTYRIIRLPSGRVAQHVNMERCMMALLGEFEGRDF